MQARLHPLPFKERRYRPLEVSEAELEFAIPRSLVASLPTLHSLPFRSGSIFYETRLYLVDSDTVRRAAIAHHGSTQAIKYCAAQTVAQRLKIAFQEMVAGPRFASWLMWGAADARRLMAVVRAPSVDKATGSVELGVSIRGVRWQSLSDPDYGWRHKYCA